jgi:hypothetical protein
MLVLKKQERMSRAKTENSIWRLASKLARAGMYVPQQMFQGGQSVINMLIADEGNSQNMIVKIRPPRFVSFTLELEPYSQKKAYALEILNDINLNVFEAETIHKMINLSTSAVIITGKRIICVYERTFDPN